MAPTSSLRRFRRYVAASALAAVSGVVPSSAGAQERVSETISFLQADGRSYVVYWTTRSTDPTSSLVYDKRKTLKDLLKNSLYINPKDYRWDDTSDPEVNLLRFRQGSFAMLDVGVSDAVKVTADGTFEYDSKRPDDVIAPGRHYGSWTDRPGGYTSFTRVWVFPDTFEIVRYECNRPGEWVVRNNTLAYYGHNVNDLLFKLAYRPKAATTYRALHTAVARPDVGVEQVAEGVRVRLAATVLFPAGAAELSASGRELLGTIADALKSRADAGVAVEGHTDDSPISGELAKTFATNWELSAARALTVVRYLATRGLPEKALEARAFGATRPRVENTPANRAQNRRIELLIVERPAGRPSAP